VKNILLPVAILGVALLGGATSANADELDAWCAQVKKASSIVICSDSDLRQQTAARQHFFDKVRETLPPDEYKTLMADQTRWVRAYTANCGVAIDGAVPALPIPQSVIACYRQASRSRNLYLLNTYGTRVAQAATPPVTPAPPPTAAPHKSEWEAAMNAWYGCLNDAVVALAGQPEPAQTVADAAFGSCTDREAAFKDSMQADWDSIAKLKAETTGGRASDGDTRRDRQIAG
jgi:hypothetical protein